MRLSVLVALLALNNITSAADLIIYPAKEQTPEQQKTDEGECFVWAREESGFDPLADASPEQVAQVQKRTGGIVRGALIGAAINDDDGAKTGAAVAATRQHRRQKKAQKQAQAEAAQKQAAVAEKRGAFDKANAACLEGRGYTVK